MSKIKTKKSLFIPHSRPTISEEDIAAVSRTLKSAKISQGEQVENFERRLSSFVGHSGAVATHSGTSALHLSLLALDISEGDQVALPSFVCSAPLHAIHYVKATPLFIDIHPGTLNMDARDLEQKITKRTKAVILPHMFGLPADIKEISSFNIPVIEDCAHSLGALYHEKRVGGLGLLSIYSFYATKMICTGEGGMITSNSHELLEKIKDLRDYDKRENWHVRYNYKMTDLAGALGMSQFSKLSSFIQKRKKIARFYHQELKNLPLELPKEYIDRDHIYYRYVLKGEKGFPKFKKRLSGAGIFCEEPVYKPLHLYFGLKNCPESEKASARCLSIPIYPSLKKSEVETIIYHIKRLFS